MSDYFDLGTYTRAVTSASDQAREWVRRGLLWAYAFNHDEAVACFEQAAATDPGCALAYWGLAYALGPNYNKQWETFEPDEARSTIARAHAAVANAHRHAAGASGAEQALITALSYRYPEGVPAQDWSVWNRAYADAMRTAYQEHPADLDVATLFADALMNLTPWALWDTATGQPAEGAATVEARAVLEQALASPGGRAHPGALHLYIHLMEMSPHPEDALWAGDLLRDLVPDGGHLLHMPTHLDLLCGDYRQVVASNEAAIRADERFVAARGQMNFYTLYRCHNHHFKIYGAMFLGQSRVAQEAADALAAAVPESLLRVTEPPMADWLEGFVAMRVHVLIRFGRWQELIDAPLPADEDLYRVTTAMLHYGKGVAFAATGQITRARAQRELFGAAVERVPESRTIFNNTCQSILQVAGAMLDGELEYRAGNIEEAFRQLRRAVELDDGLPYDEPWGWMQPARHAYGALLLEQGRVREAEAVYRADLGLDATLPRPCQHPGNVWSLHGYHECLVRLGKHEQAEIVGQQLQVALARADVHIGASCYCRLTATANDGERARTRTQLADETTRRDAMSQTTERTEQSEQGRPTVRRVRTEPNQRRVRVFFGGEAVADSNATLYLFEEDHLPVYYFPRSDVRFDLLEPTTHTTHCPYKGDASYYTVVAGGHRVENAVWAYPHPIDSVPELADYVAFYWDLAEAWYEEDDEVFRHPRDPYHRVDVLNSSRHVQVSIDGVIVAESHRPRLLFETGLPVRYYLPKLDVRLDLLTPTDTRTRCPYKGEAVYWSAAASGRELPDIAWSYPAPIPEAPKIENLITFYNERVDITVDGVLQERPLTPWS